MDWSELLEDGEQLLWSGRPAPRCYTFRNWRHSLIGLLLLILGTWWLAVGLQMAAVYQAPYLAWIPLPVCLAGLYLAFGQLLKARFEWETLFYAVTDRRLICRRGKKNSLQHLPLDALTFFRLKPYSPQLGSLAMFAGSAERRLDFKCIEQPRRVTELLEKSLRANGVLAPESD